jgi:hypothetical protein
LRDSDSFFENEMESDAERWRTLTIAIDVDPPDVRNIPELPELDRTSWRLTTGHFSSRTHAARVLPVRAFCFAWGCFRDFLEKTLR